MRFDGFRQRGSEVHDEVNECMSVRNKLLAICISAHDRHFTHQLHNVDNDLHHERATITRIATQD